MKKLSRTPQRFHTNHTVTEHAWEKSGARYNDLVGDKGHYFHENLIIPGVIRLCNFKPKDRVLDLGCGQGVFARALPKTVHYAGVDLSQSLVTFAKERDKNPAHEYRVADATAPLSFSKNHFSHAVAILSVQNMEHGLHVFKNIAPHLANNGTFVIVLNHPCFRIPRQSGWDVSENKIQYRWVNRYMSDMKIPIEMHPGRTAAGKKDTSTTWSYHQPLSAYAHELHSAGFVIEAMEEWTSDKQSQPGRTAKQEDRGRAEIPLFLAVKARKIQL